MTSADGDLRKSLSMSPMTIAVIVFMFANAFSRMMSDDLTVGLTISIVASIAAYNIANSTLGNSAKAQPND